MVNRAYPIVHNDTVLATGTRQLSFAQPETLVDFSDGNDSGVRFHLDIQGTTGTFDSFKLRCKFQLGMFDVGGAGFSEIRWYDLQAEQVKSMVLEGVDWYAGDGISKVYTNIMANPSWEANGTGGLDIAGTGGSVTPSRPTDGSVAGTTKRRTTWTTAPTAVGGGVVWGDDRNAVTGSKTYTAALEFNSNIRQRFQVGLRFYNGSTTLNTEFASSAIFDPAPAGKMNRAKVTAVAPANATSARLIIQAVSGDNGVLWTAGDWLEVDAGMIVEGNSVPDYFDGDTPGAVWNGTPHASSSTLTVAPTKEMGVVATSGMQLPITVSRSIKGFGQLVRVHIQPEFVNASADAGVTYSLNAVH